VSSLKPTKPVLFAGLDEGAKVPSAYVSELRALGVPFFPSPERAYRALARLTALAEAQVRNTAFAGMPAELPTTVPTGVVPEYRSKEILDALGIRIPQGGSARSVEEAQSVAARIGYPVALKAQSSLLSHKSDAGGVALNLAGAEAVASGWEKMLADIAHARPGLVLDGILVEKMSAKGVELIVGARNDPEWGPVLLVGFGGVLAEALHDVRLLPPDLSIQAIEAELLRLKGAALLRGFRGSPALDLRAVADIVHRLGSLMLATPQIREVDINPVVVYPQGQGAIALDALIVAQ
jgi:acyl-CoA synthetase (NDP forming)